MGHILKFWFVSYFFYRKVLLLNNEISAKLEEIETKITMTKADIQKVQQVSILYVSQGGLPAGKFAKK